MTYLSCLEGMKSTSWENNDKWGIVMDVHHILVAWFFKWERKLLCTEYEQNAKVWCKSHFPSTELLMDTL